MDQVIEFTNNHPLLATGTLIMALTVIFYEIRLRGQGIAQISTNQAVQLINQGARVVDVREQSSYDTAHIVGAIQVAPDNLQSDKRLKKQRTLILVCDNGISSGKCSNSLRAEGFDSVFSLRGGLAAWQQDNLPVVATDKA